ncbi:MAG: histidine kinase [Anaerolineae bacterium]
MTLNFNTLRVRITLAVLIMLIPMAFLIFANSELDQQKAMQQAQTDALTLTHNIANINQQHIENTRVLLTTLAQLPVIETRNGPACRTLLRGLLPEFSLYVGIFAVDTSTDMVFCTTVDTNTLISTGEMEWYQEFKRTHAFSVSSYRLTAVLQQPAVTMAAPVFNDRGEVVAAVGASLSLQWLGGFLQTQTVPEDTSIILIDDQGTVLAHYPEWHPTVIGEPYGNDEVRNAALTQAEGTISAMGLDNIARLYAYTAFGTNTGSLHAIVGLSEQVAFAQVTETRNRTATGMIIIGGLIMILAWLGSGVITHPIHQLTQTMRQIAAGRLNSRSLLSTNISELKSLTVAFNDMAAVIEKDNLQQVDQLAAANRRLRDELEERAQAQARSKLLQELGAGLSEAITSGQVAQIVTEKGLRPLGAHMSAFALYSSHSQSLQMLYLNDTNPRIDEQPTVTPVLLSDKDPLVEAFRSGLPIWVESTKRVSKEKPDGYGMPLVGVESVHAAAYLPLMVGKNAIGCMMVGFPSARIMGDYFRNLLSTIADYTTQAMERVRLYELEIRSRKLAERSAARVTLLQRVTAALSDAESTEKIAELTLEYAAALVEAECGAFYVLNATANKLQRVALLMPPDTDDDPCGETDIIRSDSPLPIAEAVFDKTAFWFASGMDCIAHFPATQAHIELRSGGHVILPVMLYDQPIGGISLHFTQTDIVDGEMRAVIGALINQCVQSFERIRLLEQAQEAAKVQERHRLARDLHDAVSQTLFSASSMAEGLSKQLERDPGIGRDLLRQIVILNRSALAEMRTLLFELRPETVTKTGLTTLFKQLIDAAKGRREIAADLTIIGEAVALPPEVHETFYRIAQESINNILKHSNARKFHVMFMQNAANATLVIKDDGVGFESDGQRSGFGLNNIHERAEAIHAQVEIISGQGEGTEIRLFWAFGGGTQPEALSNANASD